MSTAEQYELNKNLAQMLKGGVIMDVTTPEQAKIAEEAGACAVSGTRTDSCRHPCSRRRFPHERSSDDPRHSGSRIHPGYGQVPDRSFCRGTAFRGYRDRLYRRE